MKQSYLQNRILNYLNCFGELIKNTPPPHSLSAPLSIKSSANTNVTLLSTTVHHDTAERQLHIARRLMLVLIDPTILPTSMHSSTVIGGTWRAYQSQELEQLESEDHIRTKMDADGGKDLIPISQVVAEALEEDRATSSQKQIKKLIFSHHNNRHFLVALVGCR